ncbi:MAG: low molecular weight phosphotyrosine protein phosphatase [Kiritimatiellae bacterium]|nr:low molecular weight phosphotyrosine protein phosphatase [Kiritimatiellia bacterium]
MAARKILFLCHGNICRSPMAEFVMKELVRRAGRDDIEVESAALHTDEIGNDIHYGTRRKLQAEGIPFAPRRAWLLTAAKAREYDLLIGMDDYNMADLRRLVFPEDAGKIKKLLSFAGSERDIADPWYTGNFDQTYADILEGCTALLEHLDGRTAPCGGKRKE